MRAGRAIPRASDALVRRFELEVLLVAQGSCRQVVKLQCDLFGVSLGVDTTHILRNSDGIGTNL